MEGSQAGETISDIHNYLDTFNKEIQTGDQATSGRFTEVFVLENVVDKGRTNKNKICACMLS